MTEVPYTPAVVVDVPTVRRNIKTLMDYAAKHKLKVRPHTKTHKSVRVSRMQMEAGCTGLTAAKVGEARALASATHDLFIAYPVFDEYRRTHLTDLARSHTLRVGLDSAVAAERIGAAAKA